MPARGQPPVQVLFGLRQLGVRDADLLEPELAPPLRDVVREAREIARGRA